MKKPPMAAEADAIVGSVPVLTNDDVLKRSIALQRKAIADLIDLQKQFPRDSASWRHVEETMGDLLSSIDLLVH